MNFPSFKISHREQEGDFHQETSPFFDNNFLVYQVKQLSGRKSDFSPLSL